MGDGLHPAAGLARGAALLTDGAVGQDRRDQGRAAFQHEGHDLLVDAMAVLDRVHPGEHCVPGAGGAFRMGSHDPAGLVGFVDRHRHLVHGQLGRPCGLSRRHHPPSSHDLDRRGAGLDLASDGMAHGVGAIGLNTEPVAVSSGHRDHPARCEHPRARDLAAFDEACQSDVDTGSTADVPNGRDAGSQCLLQPARGADRRFCGDFVAQDAFGIRARIKTDMGVRVHEAGCQRATADRPDDGPVDLEVRFDRGNLFAAYQDIRPLVTHATSVDDSGALQEQWSRLSAAVPGHSSTSTSAQRPERLCPWPP